MQTIYDAKILIVDDNQDLLNLVTTALRSTGYNQLTPAPAAQRPKRHLPPTART